MSTKIQEPCDCGAISAILNDPDSGLTLNEDNAFQLGGVWYVYHCPFCGGLLPDSSQPIWYPRLTDEERARLEHLIAGIATAEEAIERLGPPDYDVMMHHYDRADIVEGIEAIIPLVVSEHDEIEDSRWVFNKELSQKCRNVEYYNLSEHANIEFSFHVDNGATYRIEIKCVSPRHVASG